MEEKQDVPSPEVKSSQTPWYETLSKWGALIASFAAVAGLLFTGCSVQDQSKQTKLQVQASQQQNDQLNKQQARLVNIWPASEFGAEKVLVTVSNRSEEPVYEFRLYIALATAGSRGYLAVGTWSSLPPCTQVTFDLKAIAESYPQTSQLLGAGRRLLPPFDYGIMFKDANGQSWHRHASGDLHPTPWLEYLSGKNNYNPVLPPVFKTWKALVSENFTLPQPGQKFVAVQPEPASGCDQSV
jgi:hypothetical protein